MNKLTPAKRDQYLIELYTAVLGVPGTDDKGMAGDIKELEKHTKRQNGRISKNTIYIVALFGLMAGLGLLEGTGIIHLFGV